MSIPDFQTIMLPVLTTVSNREVSTSKDVIGSIIDHFKLTEVERAELLPSKTQLVINNRTYWALVYLQKAGLIQRPARGRYQLTQVGRDVLAKSPDRIDIKFLRQFESFQQFQALSKSTSSVANGKEVETVSATDPRELLENSHEKLKASVCMELLQQVREVDPTEFELIVIELLKKMGYGVPGLESVIHRGGSGDGGIDGEISQDPLGLDMIYVQAKRYKEGQTIGRPMVQQFVGSLNERKAKKGVFITTSHFSEDAKAYVDRVDVKIVLVDGLRLAEMMFDNNLGVTVQQRYEVKKLDEDYFEGN